MNLSARRLVDGDLALVRVCTCPADELPDAWRQWLGYLPAGSRGADSMYPEHWRDLLPLVAWLQRQHRLACPDWLLNRLRTAAVLEERRLVAVRDTTAEILRVPVIAAAQPLVIGGLGIGETVYPDPASRHTGVLSLMVAAGTNLPRLAHAMKADGYRVRQAGRRARYWPFLRWARLRLVHPSGLQLFLLSAPPWRRTHPMSHARLLRHASQVQCSGNLSFFTPRIEGALTLIARGIGGEHNPMSLLPAVDSGLLLRRLHDRARVRRWHRQRPG